MAKIDRITIGSTTYDIDLPADATPSITSLTASGTITGGVIKKTNGGANEFLMGSGSSTAAIHLKAGSNISFSISGTTLTINKTNTDTWRLITPAMYTFSSTGGTTQWWCCQSGTSGVAYRGSAGTGSVSTQYGASASANRYFELQLTSGHKLQVCIGKRTKCYRDATEALTFSKAFAHIPTVIMTFGNGTVYSNYVTQLKGFSTTGFTYKMMYPSGATQSQQSFVDWIAFCVS